MAERIRITADTSEFSQAMLKAQKSLSAINKEFKESTSKLDNWRTSSEGVQAKLTQLNKQFDVEKDKLALLNSEYQETVKRSGLVSQESLTLEKALQKQEKTVDRVKKNIGEYNKTLENVKGTEHLNKLNSTIQKQEDEVKNLINQYKNLVIAQKDGTPQAEELKNKFVNLNKELKDNKDKLNDANRSTDDLVNSLNKVNDKTQKTGEGFTILKGVISNLIAQGISRLATSFSTFASDIVTVGANFEQAMQEVKAISGATGDDFDRLVAKAEELGEKTPLSAYQIAEGYKYMALAGYDVSQMLDSIDSAVDGVIASGGDFGTITDIITDGLTAFNKEAKDTPKFIDAMASTSANSNTSFLQLGESFKQSATLAGTLKYSFEDTMLALGLMANAGLKGERSGTALRNMITSLLSPTDKAKTLIKQLGINMTNADGSMKPLAEVLENLRSGFSQLNDAQKQQVATTIFGKETLSGALAVINASQDSYTKLKDSIYNSEGASRNMANTMGDSVQAVQKSVKSTVESIQIRLFKQLKPALIDTLQSFKKTLATADWQKFGDVVASVLGGFANGLKFVVKNMDTLINIVKIGGTAWLTYKAIMIATDTSTKILTVSTKLYNGISTVLNGILKKNTLELGATTKAQNLLNLAITKNPMGLLLTAIIGVTGAMFTLNASLGVNKKYIDENTGSTDNLIKKHEDLQKTLQDNAKYRQDNLNNIDLEIQSADIMVKKLDDLVNAENKSAGQKALIKDYVEKLNDLIPDLNLKYDEEKDALNKTTDAIYQNIEAQKRLALAKAGQENLVEISKDLLKNEKELAKLTEQQEKNQNTLTKAQEAYNKAVQDPNNINAFINAKRALETAESNFKKTSQAIEDNKKKTEELNKEMDNTQNIITKQYDAINRQKSLDKLVADAKKQGVAIPKAVADGIKEGAYAIPSSVQDVRSLITYDGLVQDAQNVGLQIPVEIAQGIANGSLSPQDAINHLTNLTTFTDLIKKSNLAGAEIPEQIKNGIASGQLKPTEALEQLKNESYKQFNDLVNGASKTGVDIPDNIKNGVLNGKVNIIDAINLIKGNMQDKYAQILEDAEKMGLDIPQEIRNGIEDAGNVETLNKAAVWLSNTINKKEIYLESGNAIGVSVVEGIDKGIKKQQKTLWETIQDIGANVQNFFKKTFGINSPSKVFAKLSESIPEGIALGIERKSDLAISQLDDLTQRLQMENIDLQNNVNYSLALQRGAIGQYTGGAYSVDRPLSTTKANNITFNQYNNSPRSLSVSEIYKQTNNQFFKAKEWLKNV